MGDFKSIDVKSKAAAEFLENLEIEQQILKGYNKGAVISGFEKLCEIYDEKIIVVGKLINEKSKSLSEALTKTAHMETQIKELKKHLNISNIRRLEAERKLNVYEENKETIANIMIDARKNSERMIKETEEKVDSLLEKGEIAIAEQRRNQQLVIDKLADENRKYIAYIENLENGISQIAENLERMKQDMKKAGAKV